MPITSIISQPAANSLNAAYRPIVFVVGATRTDGDPRPPVVYCDIYINSTYYKSLEKTQPFESGWQFDIQDACQEILKTFIAPNGEDSIASATSLFATISVKFRSSGYDVDGFITAEDTAPIQGTGSTSPTPGTGTASNSFYVVNATLQHDQNQDLEAHLNSYKQGTWDASAYPLTHRGTAPGGTTYKVCQGDSDYFPIVYIGDAGLSCIILNYTLQDGTTGGVNDCGLFPSCPIVSGIGISPHDNGNGTQTFTFTWGTPDPLLTSIVIQYRTDGSSGAFTNVSGSTASGRTLTLSLGLYEFKFQMDGSCNATTSSTFSGEGIEAPTCVPITITGSSSLPEAHSGVLYSTGISTAGDVPTSVTDFVGPAWMTPSIFGTEVVLSGTPDISDEGTGIPVSFTVHNACGSDDFSGSIDVTSLARTLTFSANKQFALPQDIYISLNQPVDTNFVVRSYADGFASGDCSASATSATQLSDKNFPAGDFSLNGADIVTGDWTIANSFSMYNAFVDEIPVFPGDVIFIGSFSVTIVFDGC